MKKLIFTAVGLALSFGAYALDSQIGLGQCTITTADVVNVVCKGANSSDISILSATGDDAEFITYAFATQLLGNVSSSNCTISVTGFNQNLAPVTLAGGTITVNLDSKTSTLSFSNPAFKQVNGLYWIIDNNLQEITPGNFSLTNNNMIYFKDQTCSAKK